MEFEFGSFSKIAAPTVINPSIQKQTPAYCWGFSILRRAMKEIKAVATRLKPFIIWYTLAATIVKPKNTLKEAI